MTNQTIGTLYSFVLTVTGSEKELSNFEAICKGHEIEKNNNQISVCIKVTGNKLVLTNEVETRPQVLARITPSLEKAIKESNVTVVSFT